jgi:Uma2 family endonuclease
VVVVHGETRQYLARHPGPEEVALVVEVADTTLQRDRGFKQRVYARAGIPVYWIVNLLDRQCEVYTAPSGPAEQSNYGQRQVYTASETMPVTIAGIEVGRVAVRHILP